MKFDREQRTKSIQFHRWTIAVGNFVLTVQYNSACFILNIITTEMEETSINNTTQSLALNAQNCPTSKRHTNCRCGIEWASGGGDIPETA